MLKVCRHSLAALPSVLAGLLVMACGGSDGSAVENGNGNDNGTGNGASSSGGTGQLNLGGSSPGSDNGTSGSSTTPITPGSECAKGTAAADAIPAVVQMVIDISGSMLYAADPNDVFGFGPSKWDITSEALVDAVAKLPASVAVGLNFYPNGDSDGDQCLFNDVGLPIALLGEADSRQRRDFEDAIYSASPIGGTPTHGAFLFGAETVKASKLAGKRFVLLITDGVPTYNLDCSGDGMTGVENGPLIAAVASAHGADGISTFVIGSPGSEDARRDLSQMASKGGTAKAGCDDGGPKYCHLDMTTADDFAAALASGLAEVAGAITTCEYAVPSPPTGLELDTSLVNVLYTKGDGSQSSILQDAVGDCKSGWQYDDANNPSKITLCGSDCDTVKADQGGKIDVIFGCKTETNVPVK